MTEICISRKNGTSALGPQTNIAEIPLNFSEHSNMHFIVPSFFFLQRLLARFDDPDEFNYPVNKHPGR